MIEAHFNAGLRVGENLRWRSVSKAYCFTLGGGRRERPIDPVSNLKVATTEAVARHCELCYELAQRLAAVAESVFSATGSSADEHVLPPTRNTGS